MATLSLEKSRKIISDQISRHFNQFGTTLIFFMLTTLFFGEGGSTNPELISDQFSLHFSQFGTTLIFFIVTKIFDTKSETHFRPFFSPFQLIWDNFDFFIFREKKNLLLGAQQIFLFHISSSWVNFSWHYKFQLC